MRDLRIYASELAVLAEETCANPDRECGGELLGLWSHGDAPTIFLASRPGRGAVQEETLFQQPPEVHQAVEKFAWEELGIQCVGLWHSHHQLALRDLSGGDVRRTVTYARNHGRRRFCEILAWLEPGGAQLRPYLYRDAALAVTAPCRVAVLPGESPLRAALEGLPALARGALRPAREPAPWQDHPSRALSGAAVTPLAAVEDLVEAAVPPGLRGGVELEVRGELCTLSISRGSLRLIASLSLEDGAAPALQRLWLVAPDGSRQPLPAHPPGGALEALRRGVRRLHPRSENAGIG